MAKVTIEGHTFEGNVEELMELFAKMGAKFLGEGQPETITHEGVEYKRVDREAREGDVVVFDNSDYAKWLIVGGKPYEVVGKSSSGRETFIGEDGDDYHIYNTMCANRTPANVKVYEPIVAKPAPLQVGDYARVVEEGSHSASYGDLVKVIEDAKDDQPYFCENIKGKGVGYFYPKELTRATDEEVAEAKRQQAEKVVADKWAEIGRKPNEFKEGDIVRVVAGSVYSAGTIGEVTELLNSGGLFRVEADGKLYGNWHDSDDVELITPVEHRFDKPGGDSE